LDFVIDDSLEPLKFGGNRIGSRLKNGEVVGARFIGKRGLCDIRIDIRRSDRHARDQRFGGILCDSTQLRKSGLSKGTSRVEDKRTRSDRQHNDAKYSHSAP
jgi:hypothetical protein